MDDCIVFCGVRYIKVFKLSAAFDGFAAFVKRNGVFYFGRLELRDSGENVKFFMPRAAKADLGDEVKILDDYFAIAIGDSDIVYVSAILIEPLSF